jgi:protein associated with RNAse G/E
VKKDAEKIELVGTFEDRVEHPDLGIIEAGTVSHERFYLNRWYNYFIFEQPPGSLRNYYINICMPPSISDGVVDYVDLDIDVIVWPDGRMVTVDMDEFEANGKIYSYPDHVREITLETLCRVQDGDWL